MIANDARCMYEIKCRIAMAKEGSFHQQIQIQICRIATSDAETWTLQKQDNKHLERSEMWCWRRMEKISWTNHVRNTEVLRRGKEERNSVSYTQ
jgi:hypothetical protein